MKKTASFIVFAVLLVAWGGKKHTGDFELKGTLSNAPAGETIYLEELSPNGKMLVDSTKLDDNGNFSFTSASPSAGFYRVKINEANFAMLILDSTQKITVTGDFKDLGNTYKAEGSPDTKVFLELNDLGKIIQMRADSFQRVFQGLLATSKRDSATMDSINKTIEPAYMKMLAEHQKKVSEVVVKNSSSLAALV